MTQPMVQKLVPVMATKDRVLGTVALDAETTFSGSEPAVVIDSQLCPLRMFTQLRLADDSAVQFMGIFIDQTQERNGMERHLPRFESVTDNTQMSIWTTPGSTVKDPRQGDSTWEKFFRSLPAQSKSLLPQPTHLQDA